MPAAIRCKPPTGIPPTMHPTKSAAAAAAMASLAACSTAGKEELRLSKRGWSGREPKCPTTQELTAPR
jgi:hypothetical protein